jgi:hypothetical protein
MLGYSRAADGAIVGALSNGVFLLVEQLDDLPANRVPEGVEGVLAGVEGVHGGLVRHMVI